jgi:hypothetical protein
MPSARDQAAERSVRRACWIDVELLRVVAARKVDDLVSVDLNRPVVRDRAWRVVLEVPLIDADREIGLDRGKSRVGVQQLSLFCANRGCPGANLPCALRQPRADCPPGGGSGFPDAALNLG